jgi:hypothetical protein
MSDDRRILTPDEIRFGVRPGDSYVSKNGLLQANKLMFHKLQELEAQANKTMALFLHTQGLNGELTFTEEEITKTLKQFIGYKIEEAGEGKFQVRLVEAIKDETVNEKSDGVVAESEGLTGTAEAAPTEPCCDGACTGC